MTELRTRRLRLRRFGDADRPAFADLNADPIVMATIGAPMSAEQSDAFIDRIEDGWDERGFGLWCVDLDGECIGFAGLAVPWFRDGVEVGWRLRSRWWGQGYATEAGAAAIAFAFDHLRLDEVISFTAVSNVRSRRVMERLGLRREPDQDFDHPSLPDGHELRPHVLYRLDAAGYRART